MSPEAQKTRDIFVAAVKVPPDQWEALLKEACAGDEELRRQVSDLLQEHQQAGSFLDQPAAHVRATGEFESGANGVSAAGGEKTGTIIGPYKLLELIGEGGMGAIWMAEQREPVRKVALKIIKAGMDTRQVVARFEAERQALALMDHPNIAKVFDGGTTASGRPYFVMELVKGVPITRYCDEHRLTPRERLELFLPVCQAIQHAHQKGIIHRDVKPANVLVAPYDGRPVPKVIDFGVAKATGQRLTERTLFTGFGAVVGTLEYMSPEQAELNNQDIDTRSDIYSLGVLLYELLTGTTPLSHERLKQVAFTDMLRIIREEEPPRPSTRLGESNDTLPSISAQRQMEPAKLTKLVRGELDWIVMKALEKDRNRRYETANGLAMDVQHYLADEPVQACPPTIGYRLRKFLRRNKGPMIAASLLLLTLVGGIIGTTWGLFRADKAREDAVAAQRAEAKRAEGERRAKEAETTERLRAEGNAKLAMAVLDEIIMKGARQRLTLYTQDEARGIAKSPEREKLEREYLEKGLRFYEQLAQTNASDWAARRDRAKAYANVGRLHWQLKNYTKSAKAYGQAVVLMGELAGERPSDFDTVHELAVTYNWSYWPYMDGGQLQPAEEVTRRSLALFSKLAADFPGHLTEALGGLANGQWNLGMVFHKAGKPKEAREAVEQALGIWTELAAASPDAREPRSQLAYMYWTWAELLKGAGQEKEAEESCRRALGFIEQLAADYPSELFYRQEKAYQSRGLGLLLKNAGRVAEAEKFIRQALPLYEGLAAERPDNAFYLQEFGYTYWMLAVAVLQPAGRAEEAEHAYRQAVAIHEELATTYPGVADYRERLLSTRTELVDNLLRQGKHAEAAKVAEKMADPLPKDSIGFERAVLLWIRCMALAEKDTALSEADRRTVAKRYADRSLELLQEAAKRGLDTPGVRELQEALRLPRDDPQAHYHLGVALFQQGKFAEAEAECREAVRLRPDYVEAHYYLGKALTDQAKHAEAEAELREALRLRPDFRQGYVFVGLVLVRQGKPAAALRFYTDSFAAELTLADDLRYPNRYNAACSAALVGCGQAKDAANLDDAERARLRRQALDWLRADLAAWRQLLGQEPDKSHPRVQQQLRHWQQDPDFAWVRGDALAKLPEAERQSWQQLWADVEQILKRVNEKDTKDTKKKSPK